MTLLLKDPDSILDYAVDWSSEYLGEDIVTQSSWTIDPVEDSGVIVIASEFDSGMTTVTAGGGIAGHIYQLTNPVVLASGLTDNRSVTLRVEHR